MTEVRGTHVSPGTRNTAPVMINKTMNQDYVVKYVGPEFEIYICAMEHGMQGIANGLVQTFAGPIVER
jgi:hypothetical protein